MRAENDSDPSHQIFVNFRKQSKYEKNTWSGKLWKSLDNPMWWVGGVGVGVSQEGVVGGWVGGGQGSV